MGRHVSEAVKSVGLVPAWWELSLGSKQNGELSGFETLSFDFLLRYSWH